MGNSISLEMNDGVTLRLEELPKYLQKKDNPYFCMTIDDTLYASTLPYDLWVIEAKGFEAWLEFAVKRAKENIKRHIDFHYF